MTKFCFQLNELSFGLNLVLIELNNNLQRTVYTVTGYLLQLFKYASKT